MIKVRCSICQREMTGERSAWPQFPFCSPRCKTIDLGRWLGERYKVPSEDEDGDDDDDSSPSGQSSGRSP